MKKICYSMVKNEAGIIGLFIRHNLYYFDHIFITDNNSSDDTPLIIEQLIGEGLPITLWYDYTLEHIQSEITTQAYHKISSIMDFDLFFPLDADELLVVDGSFDSIDLNNLSYNIDRYDYVIKNENSKILDMTSRLITKDRKGKIFICHKKEKAKSIRISQGNHYIFYNGIKDQSKETSALWLAHFPYRGINHYINKILIGSQAMIVRDKRYLSGKSAMATHWYKEYTFLKSKKNKINFDDYLERIFGTRNITELDQLTTEKPIFKVSNYRYLGEKLNNLDNYSHNLILNYEKLATDYLALKNASLLMIASQRFTFYFKSFFLKMKMSIKKRINSRV